MRNSQFVHQKPQQMYGQQQMYPQNVKQQQQIYQQAPQQQQIQQHQQIKQQQKQQPAQTKSAQPQTPQNHLKDQMIATFTHQCLVEEQKNNEVLGDIKIYRLHPFMKFVACKNITLQPNVNYSDLANYRHPGIFYCTKFETDKKNANVYVEYNFLSLKESVQQRSSKKFLFPEHELWLFMKQIVGTMKFLQEKEIFHGDLSTNTIFFDDEYLMNRIYNNYMFGEQYAGYKKVLQDEQATISPELIQCIRVQEQLHTGYNFYKADVFSVGMAMLEIATLQDSLECYDFDQKSINFNTVQQRIQSVSKMYSMQFTQILTKFLELDYRKRLDWKQLSQQMADPEISRLVNNAYNLNSNWMKTQEQIRKNHQYKQMEVLNIELNLQTKPTIPPFKVFTTEEKQQQALQNSIKQHASPFKVQKVTSETKEEDNQQQQQQTNQFKKSQVIMQTSSFQQQEQNQVNTQQSNQQEQVQQQQLQQQQQTGNYVQVKQVSPQQQTQVQQQNSPQQQVSPQQTVTQKQDNFITNASQSQISQTQPQQVINNPQVQLSPQQQKIDSLKNDYQQLQQGQQQSQQQQQLQQQQQRPMSQSQIYNKNLYTFEGMRNTLSKQNLQQKKKFMSSSQIFERENMFRNQVGNQLTQQNQQDQQLQQQDINQQQIKPKNMSASQLVPEQNHFGFQKQALYQNNQNSQIIEQNALKNNNLAENQRQPDQQQQILQQQKQFQRREQSVGPRIEGMFQSQLQDSKYQTPSKGISTAFQLKQQLEQQQQQQMGNSQISTQQQQFQQQKIQQQQFNPQQNQSQLQQLQQQQQLNSEQQRQQGQQEVKNFSQDMNKTLQQLNQKIQQTLQQSTKQTKSLKYGSQVPAMSQTLGGGQMMYQQPVGQNQFVQQYPQQYAQPFQRGMR